MIAAEIEARAGEYTNKNLKPRLTYGFEDDRIRLVKKAFQEGAKWGLEHAPTEANEIIKDLLYCTDGIVTVSIPEEHRFLSVKELKARAEKFLKESEK